jgi:type IV secretion system protein VirD4
MTSNGKILLGWRKAEKGGFQEPVWDETDEGHLITIAPTGAGKGVSCAIPATLAWDGPAVVIDPKGENYAVTARQRVARGQKVHLLDPFRVTAARQSDRLDPLDLVGHGESLNDDAAMIAAMLCSPKPSFKDDPFWDERARALVVEAITYVIEEKGVTAPTLSHVKDVIEDYAVRGDLPARPGDFQPFGFGVERTRTSIVATACSHLSVVADGRVAKCLRDSTIFLEDIEDGIPLTLYIVVPPEKLQSHAALLRVWLGVIMAALARRRSRKGRPTLVLVDEAAQLGELDMLRSMLTLMRGYGARVWTFWQDLSQLRNAYKQDWESILNNSTTQQFFFPGTPSAARQLKDVLGDAFPQPLSSLKADDVVLVRPGARIEVVRRADYRRDPMFNGLHDANPFYGETGGEEARRLRRAWDRARHLKRGA